MKFLDRLSDISLTPRRVVAGTVVAALLVASACSGDDGGPSKNEQAAEQRAKQEQIERDLQAIKKAEDHRKIAVARAAGFTAYAMQDGSDIHIVFGGCVLEARVEEDSDHVPAVFLVDAPGTDIYGANAGFVESGIDRRLELEMSSPMTLDRLDAMTRLGLTGLAPCLLTAQQANQSIDQLGS